MNEVPSGPMPPRGERSVVVQFPHASTRAKRNEVLHPALGSGTPKRNEVPLAGENAEVRAPADVVSFRLTPDGRLELRSELPTPGLVVQMLAALTAYVAKDQVTSGSWHYRPAWITPRGDST